METQQHQQNECSYISHNLLQLKNIIQIHQWLELCHVSVNGFDYHSCHQPSNHGPCFKAYPLSSGCIIPVCVCVCVHVIMNRREL